MTDALLAVARTEEGGVRTKHLERECARALSDNFTLQARLQEALARARNAEEQLMMIRPYALYGQSMSMRQRGGMGLGLAMPPNPVSFNPSLSGGGFSSGYKPAGPPSKPALSPVVIPSSSSTAIATPRSSGPITSATSNSSTASAPGARKQAPLGASNSPLSNTRAGGSPDSFEDLISAAQRALDSETSPEGQPPSVEEPRRKELVPDASQRERSQSALDVLVAAAFGDSAGEIGTSTAGSLAEGSASSQSQQPGDPEVAGSKPSSRKSEMGEDGSERGEHSVRGASDTPKARSDPGTVTKKTSASVAAPAKSLPAFMSYAPDYKSIGSTSGSASTSNKLPYATHPALVRHYYAPPLPMGYGLPAYSPPKSMLGQPGLTPNPFNYRGPATMPFSQSPLAKIPSTSSSVQQQQSIWPVRRPPAKVKSPPRDNNAKASTSSGSQVSGSVSATTAPARSLDRTASLTPKLDTNSARKGKKRAVPQYEPELSESELEGEERGEEVEENAEPLNPRDNSENNAGDLDEDDPDPYDLARDSPRRKRRRTNSSAAIRTNPAGKVTKASGASNIVSFAFAFVLCVETR